MHTLERGHGEDTLLSHLPYGQHSCLPFNLSTSPIPPQLHRKTSLTALVTTAGEGNPWRCTRRRSPEIHKEETLGDAHAPGHPPLLGRTPEVVPQPSLGSPSIPPHAENPSSLLQPSLETPRPPSSPRALAHMFVHAGTEHGGETTLQK